MSYYTDLFYREVIKEIGQGKLKLNGDDYLNIKFNTLYLNKNKEYDCISGKMDQDVPSLLIKNRILFEKKLNEYINEFEKNRKASDFHNYNKRKVVVKELMAFLWVNATEEGFKNPIEQINQRIAFLKDNTFENKNKYIELGSIERLDDSVLSYKILEDSIFMETSNKICFRLTKKINEETLYYDFPSISYGIYNSEAYIYSIQKKIYNIKESELQKKYNKKIKRLLFKLNKNITEGEEYQEYKKGNNAFYPHNISDVTPSAIASVTMLLSMLEGKNISKINIVPYLPIRWNAKHTAIRNMCEEYLPERREEEYRINTAKCEAIQSNITDKFIRTFFRVEHHLDNCEIMSLLDSSTTIKIQNKGNNIIENTMLEEMYYVAKKNTNIKVR